MSTYILRNIFNPEFSLARSQGRALFELGLAEEPVDDPEAQDLRRLRLPLDDDRVLLLVGVTQDHLRDALRHGGGGGGWFNGVTLLDGRQFGEVDVAGDGLAAGLAEVRIPAPRLPLLLRDDERLRLGLAVGGGGGGQVRRR